LLELDGPAVEPLPAALAEVALGAGGEEAALVSPVLLPENDDETPLSLDGTELGPAYLTGCTVGATRGCSWRRACAR
jgi:hypothetical protein